MSSQKRPITTYLHRKQRARNTDTDLPESTKPTHNSRSIYSQSLKENLRPKPIAKNKHSVSRASQIYSGTVCNTITRPLKPKSLSASFSTASNKAYIPPKHTETFLDSYSFHTFSPGAVCRINTTANSIFSPFPSPHHSAEEALADFVKGIQGTSTPKLQKKVPAQLPVIEAREDSWSGEYSPWISDSLISPPTIYRRLPQSKKPEPEPEPEWESTGEDMTLTNPIVAQIEFNVHPVEASASISPIEDQHKDNESAGTNPPPSPDPIDILNSSWWAEQRRAMVKDMERRYKGKGGRAKLVKDREEYLKLDSPGSDPLNLV